ncbi:MAG: hypothetical protein ABSB41_03915 [Anaerolineales bacterium]|jgi:hypothetical protein
MLTSHQLTFSQVKMIVRETLINFSNSQDGNLQAVEEEDSTIFVVDKIHSTTSEDRLRVLGWYDGSVRVDWLKESSDPTNADLQSTVLKLIDINVRAAEWRLKYEAATRAATQSPSPKGRPGRPPSPDDEWAWAQVNEFGRSKADVFREWSEREGVGARNLVDPKGQFKRITKPGWGTKSRQNI